MHFVKYMIVFALVICATLEPIRYQAAEIQRNTISSEAQNKAFDPFMADTLLSGPTSTVPWENDPQFISAKEKNGCPVLMAAYKTVLKDPLPGEEYNVHLAADYISGTVVAPNHIFSQNKIAGPYTADRGFRRGPTYKGTKVYTTVGGGVCKIASTLYNVSVLSNLSIVERYSHSMPVPYVPYGQDATVYYGVKDLKFRNTTQSPILIWAKGIDNSLYIGFYGQAKPPKVVWGHEVLKVYKAPKFYQKNPNLLPGTQNILHEGMDGAIIKSWVTIAYPDGSTERKKMGKCYYDPLPYVIEVKG